MTKRIIDADALLERVRKKSGYIKDSYTNVSYNVVALDDVMQIINEMVTPTEPLPNTSKEV